MLVAVGTFCLGFDELVEAADRAARDQGRTGFAQIGQGRYVPIGLSWARFLPGDDFRRRLVQASLVVCHGGMGILGDAMRAGRPIIAVPRRGATSAAHPANDQLPLLRHLARRYPIHICEEPASLAAVLARVSATGPVRRDYDLGSNVSQLVADFLAAGARRRTVGRGA